MPSYADSLKVTCELLRAHVEEVHEIRPSDRIQQDLGLDSLAVMEFAADVEARFGISIPADMYEQIVTVEDIARAVVTLSNGGR
jgi:acyl carrier protein